MKAGRKVKTDILAPQQRQVLGWLRRYVATVSQEAIRLGLSKVPAEMKLPEGEVADRLLAGLLAAYIRQTTAWAVSEERQRRIWQSAVELVEEQTREQLELRPIDG